MSGFRDFTELQVFQLAERRADAVWDVVSGWHVFARDTVGKQLVRAADSVGANIAEGHGCSALDNRRIVRIAKRSLNETRYWLRRSQSRKLLSAEQVKDLHEILNELAPKLGGYLAALGRRVK
jgi:four helix bundle protein